MTEERRDDDGTVEIDTQPQGAKLDLVTRTSESGSVSLYLYVLDENGNQLVEHPLTLEQAEMLATRAAEAVEALRKGAAEG